MIQTLWMGRYDDRDTIVIGTLWVEHCRSDGYSRVGRYNYSSDRDATL